MKGRHCLGFLSAKGLYYSLGCKPACTSPYQAVLFDLMPGVGVLLGCVVKCLPLLFQNMSTIVQFCCKWELKATA